MPHGLTAEESAHVLHACREVEVSSYPPEQFRGIVVYQLSSDRPELAAKVNGLAEAQLSALCEELADRQ